MSQPSRDRAFRSGTLLPGQTTWPRGTLVVIPHAAHRLQKASSLSKAPSFSTQPHPPTTTATPAVSASFFGSTITHTINTKIMYVLVLPRRAMCLTDFASQILHHHHRPTSSPRPSPRGVDADRKHSSNASLLLTLSPGSPPSDEGTADLPPRQQRQ